MESTSNTNIVQILKVSKLVSYEDLEQSVSGYLVNCMSLRNVCFYYFLSEVFNARKLYKITQSYIERCFQQVAHTNGYLELSYKFVMKIVKSSELNITSELSVLKAIVSWVGHKHVERNCSFEKLLLQIRLQLLPVKTLKELKFDMARFSKEKHIEEIFEKTIKLKKTNSNINHKGHRVCSQNKYSVLCIGQSTEINTDTGVFRVSGENFKQVSELRHVEGFHSSSVTVDISGTIYIVGSFIDGVEDRVVYRFTPGISDRWKIIGSFPSYNCGFGVCSAFGKIYVLGGKFREYGRGHCFCFDPENDRSQDLPCMIGERKFAACTGFEESIFVCGGLLDTTCLNTAEVFDIDKMIWRQLPSMVMSRARHQAVAYKNKVFVIGDGSKFHAEFYDSASNAFTILKNTPKFSRQGEGSSLKAVLVNDKIYMFGRNVNKIYLYDIERETWSAMKNKLNEKLTKYFACLKLPTY